MRIIFAMIAFLLSGGGQAVFAQEPQTPASPSEIVAYRDSGQWDADTTRVIRQARRQVRRHFADAKPAIVLDIDDTALSSYQCRKAVHFTRGNADCAGSGAMPAIPQTRGLYRYARTHHVTVFFVTGRRAEIRRTTIRNLHRAGYAGTLRVKLRPNVERPGTHDGWKARTRRAIERRGYMIVANVGDQRSDLDGGAALRAFKLPNPMYVIPTA
jgi:predicted secreted acid phosphatase